MFVLSAFADEISPDPQEQIEVLTGAGVRHIEFRSILKTNVLLLTDLQVREFKSLLDQRGFKLSAIGSPIGKAGIDQPFADQEAKLKRAIELCKLFETPRIRIFSFYPPEGEGSDWKPWRDEVLSRMRRLAEQAQQAGVVLFHENEHRIYGDHPDRVADIFQSVQNPALKAAYDPANYVFCGFDPLEGWQKTKQYTAHFHIKDWKAGEPYGRLAGYGDGQIAAVMAEATRAGYDGFATLEPHLRGGGPTGGITGPDLFPRAVEAFRKILDSVGATYR